MSMYLTIKSWEVHLTVSHTTLTFLRSYRIDIMDSNKYLLHLYVQNELLLLACEEEIVLLDLATTTYRNPSKQITFSTIKIQFLQYLKADRTKTNE